VPRQQKTKRENGQEKLHKQQDGLAMGSTQEQKGKWAERLGNFFKR
jgi:hypothetical protein